MRTPGVLRRMLDVGRSPAVMRGSGSPRPDGGERHLVDPNTRTFWSRGVAGAATLVEAEDLPPSTPTGRAATMVAEHESGTTADGRPRANPAFSEAVFVELMRARQYRRAFALLTPECQQSWGALESFIAAQRIGSLAQLRGVRVTEVRHLEGWRDTESGMVHDHAAELEVEYDIGDGTTAMVVPRTVHLVAHRGQWRSLCYPTATSPR